MQHELALASSHLKRTCSGPRQEADGSLDLAQFSPLHHVDLCRQKNLVDKM